jgi:metal-responsive CopG/Arc/MetJ family transcriptional regulator
MPTEKPKVLITLEDDLLQRIEDFRYGNRIPSRAEAVRKLIEEGLKNIETSKPQPKKK